MEIAIRAILSACLDYADIFEWDEEHCEILFYLSESGRANFDDGLVCIVCPEEVIDNYKHEVILEMMVPYGFTERAHLPPLAPSGNSLIYTKEIEGSFPWSREIGKVILKKDYKIVKFPSPTELIMLCLDIANYTVWYAGLGEIDFCAGEYEFNDDDGKIIINMEDRFLPENFETIALTDRKEKGFTYVEVPKIYRKVELYIDG